MLASTLAHAYSTVTRLAPLTWAAAIAGIWLLPLPAVVVLTGVSVAGTRAREATPAASDRELAVLVHAIDRLTRDGEMTPRLRRVR